MMPTDQEADPASTNKKRHTGNDFVNIVWNNSGQDYKFDTFPSAFNYVYIVITPETQASFSDLRANLDKYFYQVQVQSAPGFPEISPAAETKVVSAKSLPGFIRLLALNASVFSLVWANKEGGEHFSPWRNRLRQIKALRDKYAKLNPQQPHQQARLASPSSGNLSSQYHSMKSPSPAGLIMPPPSTAQAASAQAAQIDVKTPGSTSVSRERERTKGASSAGSGWEPQRASLATHGSLSEVGSGSRSSFATSSGDTGDD